MKTKEVKKTIVIMIFIIAIPVLIGTVKVLNIEELNIPSIIILSSFSISISIIISFPIIKIIEKMVIKSAEDYQHDNIDYEYYRDIVEEHSIAVLAECHGKKVNYKDQLVATLLKLIISKKIYINEHDEIVILDNSNLAFSEQMMIKAYQGSYIFSKKYIKAEIKNDNRIECQKSDCFIFDEEQPKSVNVLAIIITILILVDWFSILLVSGKMQILAIIAFLMFFPIALLVSQLSKGIDIRSEKGKEIQKKLFGLEKFLKEYSLINNKGLEDIELWDYYIIYAILFNFKGRLNNEAYKYYNKYIEKLLK